MTQNSDLSIINPKNGLPENWIIGFTKKEQRIFLQCKKRKIDLESTKNYRYKTSQTFI